MILKNTIILTATVVIVVTLLALVNSYTEPIIEQNQRVEFQDQIDLMFPDSVRTEKTPAYEEGKLVGDYYQVYDKYGDLIGYVVQQETNGYGGEIRLLVGFYENKTIRSVKILRQTETPGIGTKIEQPSFLNQFQDRRTAEDVDTITGATISSEAVISGVEEAVDKLR